ncbi:MAG: ATP-binding cassette domain-containing protein [Clostridia bacterium]|nr:ATP-binding cassette domain-containing protein [Clostridia bacterium]
MNDLAIRIEHVSKQYRLGAIGGGTLKGDIQSFIARRKGQEDPNSKIGSDAAYHKNERFLALDDVSLDVKKGEIVGIIGHNGAGKSTLLKLLSRVTAPTAGRICINGRIASMLEVGTGFHPELTGRENVYMNGAILGMNKAEIDRKFDDIVKFAEMEKFIDTPVKRYSSGMYVKLAFAVAAHLDSEIMVMDEVLAVGDMKFQDKCLGKMSDVSNQEGRTVLYVSHNMSTIKRLCQRCIVLDHGKIIFDGDVNEAIEIYSNSERSYDYRHVFEKADYWDYYARTTQMLSVEFLDSKDCIFEWGKPIRCSLTCRSDAEIDNLRLRIEFYNATESLTGVACSDYIGHFGVGETRSIPFSFETKMLSAGKYKLSFALYYANELGMSTTVDLGRNALRFQLNDTPCEERIIGDFRLGGFTRYPDIVLGG